MDCRSSEYLSCRIPDVILQLVLENQLLNSYPQFMLTVNTQSMLDHEYFQTWITVSFTLDITKPPTSTRFLLHKVSDLITVAQAARSQCW
jgi:hypothetical protein